MPMTTIATPILAGTKPGVAAKRRSGHEQHNDGDCIRDAQGQPGFRDEEERNCHRKGGQENQQEYAERPQPIVLTEPGMQGRLGQLTQLLPHHLEFGFRQDGRQHRRQGIGNDAMRRGSVGGLAHGTQRDEAVPLLAEAGHQIEDRINDSPGQIAAQRSDQHLADFAAAGVGDAERAGEGEHHDQPEQDFRDALHRFEQAFARVGRGVSHGSARSCAPQLA